ncbi:MAG TPA: hypothetical protein VIK80_05915 [Flavihumibacter sp.]
MRKFIKDLLLFFAILFIAYTILVFVTGRIDFTKTNLVYKLGGSGHMRTRISELKQVTDLDILFLGSSHCYRGFDPRNFKDKKTFNLGSSNQTPIQTNLLLERYLDRINPGLVIYAISPDEFVNDGVESSLDIITNDDNDFGSVRMTFEVGNLKTFNTLIYAGIGDWFNMDDDFVEPLRRMTDTYVPGGYVERDMDTFKYQTYPKQEWKFRRMQLSKFHKNLEMLKERGIKTILVFPPLTSGLYNSYTNQRYIDSVFSSCGLEYYNFNKIMQLDDSLHFYDADHLNQRGVKLFNQKLIETLGL